RPKFFSVPSTSPLWMVSDHARSRRFPHSRKQIRLHLRLLWLHAVGQMEDFLPSALADGLFKEAEQRCLRGVDLESGDLQINFPRLKLNYRGGGCQQDWLAVRHGKERGGVEELLGLMGYKAVLQLFREAVGASGPMAGGGGKN